MKLDFPLIVRFLDVTFRLIITAKSFAVQAFTSYSKYFAKYLA